MIEVVDSEEDFKVFDRSDLTEFPGNTSRSLPSAQISSNQESADIPEAMVLQRRKDTSILELLESHTGGSTPKMPIQTWPLTPSPSYTSSFEQPERREKETERVMK